MAAVARLDEPSDSVAARLQRRMLSMGKAREPPVVPPDPKCSS